jgi:hypothetical protein
LRILERVLGLVLAAILVLQAIATFRGYPIHGIVGGIELIVLAALCAYDAIEYIQKPKRPFLRLKFRQENGNTDEFVVRADRAFTLEENPKGPICSMDIVFFESDKEEATAKESKA